MDMLILSPGVAAAVAGPTSTGVVLAPRPLADGTFALPARVLGDVDHAAHHAALAACPRLPLEACVWPPTEDA